MIEINTRERKRSKKKVIPLEKCFYKFVFDVDGKSKIVPASRAHFYSLKIMAKDLKFKNYSELDYDPFNEA